MYSNPEWLKNKQTNKAQTHIHKKFKKPNQPNKHLFLNNLFLKIIWFTLEQLRLEQNYISDYASKK